MSIEELEKIPDDLLGDERDGKGLPVKLLGDQMRLQQVLINLTKNALKFTHWGKIIILAAYDYSNEMLQVQIIDSGKGIEEKEMRQLFTLFGKLERTED